MLLVDKQNDGISEKFHRLSINSCPPVKLVDTLIRAASCCGEMAIPSLGQMSIRVIKKCQSDIRSGLHRQLKVDLGDRRRSILEISPLLLFILMGTVMIPYVGNRSFRRFHVGPGYVAHFRRSLA